MIYLNEITVDGNVLIFRLRAAEMCLNALEQMFSP